MTLLLNQRVPEFDNSEALQKEDRAQPIAIESSEHFIVLTQQDGGNDCTHCILVERGDIGALISLLQKEPT
jgi:hypothetical protein